MNTRAQNALMAHHIIGYPDATRSAEIIESYISSGVEILELQIPFSHPTADGLTLTQANRQAVAAGIDTEFCFDYLDRLHHRHPDQKVMLMSYLNKLFANGLIDFIDRVEQAGIQHLIVPDLPLDSPPARQIAADGRVQLVPVLASNMSRDRLESALRNQPDYAYCLADFKTTGSSFSLRDDIAAFIASIRRESPQTRIGLGFGISEAAHVTAALKQADFAIVGSALKRAIDDDRVAEKLAELLNSALDPLPVS